ncbi:FecR family protein [Sphingomonas colocasiae]|uniref:FecR domain-containing protein n=1 Tax=Sphingomonas colocasiae TaxID=1848973 RepID=A0ABS7PSP9_9SPHN|nr:FecR domain-containing protein [Sphingomonas colocasiae]MBY8824367.1 FecR domain-containing protein [Sphingomonas colocasiae]
MNGGSFDKAGFDAWLAADPRRKPLFDTMWRRIMGADIDQALHDYGRRRRSRKRLAAGAAACMLFLSAAYQARPAIELFLAPSHNYAAADGVIREVRLDDGTRLTLAGGAEVQVRYTRHEREVTLMRGTIFADVRRDETRVFRVEAGDGEITVLGTRFEVALKPDMVRTAVEHGTVRFGRDRWFGTPLELGADQAASLTPDGLSRDAGGPHRVARWRAEWAEYENATLGQVIADLESVSPVPIIIDGALAERRVNGRIRLTDPLRQVRNLSVVHEFKVSENGNAITLSQ